MFFIKYSYTLELSSGTKLNMIRYAKSRKDLYDYYAKQKYYYHLGQKNKIISLKNIESDDPGIPQSDIYIEGKPVVITQKLLESLPY